MNEKDLKLIEKIAKRIFLRLPYTNNISYNDLVNQGYLGYCAAIESFDSTKNVSFQTYAYYKISGAILDFLRQNSFISRNARKYRKNNGLASSDLSIMQPYNENNFFTDRLLEDDLVEQEFVLYILKKLRKTLSYFNYKLFIMLYICELEVVDVKRWIKSVKDTENVDYYVASLRKEVRNFSDKNKNLL